MKSTPFNIEINSILKIISKDIYDSPLSLLRENVQNAYDAILMRQKKDEKFRDAKINISLDGQHLVVEDNGIGMTYENLKDNYWTAGSSGKNNDLARSAGVVGTFGIGAMANFGVCTSLEVISRYYGSDVTITSRLNRDEISLSENCIIYDDTINHKEDYGTSVSVTLDSDFKMTKESAIEYLSQYVGYIQIPILFNGDLISKKDYSLHNPMNPDRFLYISDHYKYGDWEFDYNLLYSRSTSVSPQIYVYNIIKSNKKVEGDVKLDTISGNQLFGCRNGFGLAQMPIGSSFNFGGIVNLKLLTPTAGRDAISRESIDFVTRLISIADDLVAEKLSQTPMADNSREFQQYVRSHKKYDLANNIAINIAGGEERITLGEINKVTKGKMVYFYQGSDKALQNSYLDKNNMVLVPANDYTRKMIQIAVLKKKGIPEISDEIKVLREYKDEDLSVSEITIKVRIQNIMTDQYFINNCEIHYAVISHNVSVKIEKIQDKLVIYLAKDSKDLAYLTELYESEYGMLEPMVTDFVRSRLYPKFSQYVPSAKRDGTDAFYAMLQRKKELYTIDSYEMGAMDIVIDEYKKGKISINDVLKTAIREKKSQKQEVSSVHVGNIGDVLGTVPTASNKAPMPMTQQALGSFDAMPPIMRLSTDTKYKILRSSEPEEKLNGYTSFLAISDKMYRDLGDFFLQPHTTRVIWSMHKIIYIFALPSNNLTLYYDMELETPLSNTGGRLIPSSTIVTKGRIFIPIIDEMDDYFNVREGTKKFYVRYDSVRN